MAMSAGIELARPWRIPDSAAKSIHRPCALARCRRDRTPRWGFPRRKAPPHHRRNRRRPAFSDGGAEELLHEGKPRICFQRQARRFFGIDQPGPGDGARRKNDLSSRQTPASVSPGNRPPVHADLATVRHDVGLGTAANGADVDRGVSQQRMPLGSSVRAYFVSNRSTILAMTRTALRPSSGLAP